MLTHQRAIIALAEWNQLGKIFNTWGILLSPDPTFLKVELLYTVSKTFHFDFLSFFTLLFFRDNISLAFQYVFKYQF